MSVTDDVRHHHTRCARDRARLQMLAGDAGGAPLSPGVVRQVIQATSAVLAEATEAARAALTVGPASHRPSGRRSFLAARLTRLENAAHEAIASARAGDTAALRQGLRRFDTLTSAMWTVQLAVCDQGDPGRPAGRI
ncbi:MAG TPA: hypothetical protein VGN41_19720 [Streptosporangiaceae bacterium]|jgi:hypothetical protein